ncbi:MAG TPA: glycogen synthase GlgA [Vicinamibacterales bacterium]|nr:glycogen synthase GlgA [Vicinamibacterales bacterium]
MTSAPEAAAPAQPQAREKKPATPRRTAAPRKARGAEPAAADAPQAGGQPAASLRILMVTSEAHPFAKTGGLAEVSAALPAALARLGHAVTLVLPRYQGVEATGDVLGFEFSLGSRAVAGQFVERRLPEGVRAVLVDIPEFYDRPGLYGADGVDYPDNAMRFAALSRAALEYARLKGERPDIIHAHDWQTGLVPVYQKMHFSNDPVVGRIPVVFTIHNLAFQGVFGAATLDAIGLGWDVFHPNAMEYWGNISLLKGGVNFSEKITTVSPTYAREILTPEFGFGLEGVLARRAADLAGIVNGIDTERWNPAADPFVPATYSADDLSGKRDAKRALLADAGLPSDDAALERPVIGIISRLTDQKGFDLVGAAARELMELDAAWVMLGSGERHHEDLLRAMAQHHPDRVSATIGFDERLAHLIEAGADMFLMPSRFEPCGLNQLYSLRYGTIPIVRATGGLEDTVTDAAQPGGNGVKFSDYSPAGLLAAVRRALDLYRDPVQWQQLQRAAMSVDPSWDVSAREYVKVYGELQNR